MIYLYTLSLHTSALHNNDEAMQNQDQLLMGNSSDANESQSIDINATNLTNHVANDCTSTSGSPTQQSNRTAHGPEDNIDIDKIATKRRGSSEKRRNKKKKKETKTEKKTKRKERRNTERVSANETKNNSFFIDEVEDSIASRMKRRRNQQPDDDDDENQQSDQQSDDDENNSYEY